LRAIWPNAHEQKRPGKKKQKQKIKTNCAIETEAQRKFLRKWGRKQITHEQKLEPSDRILLLGLLSGRAVASALLETRGRVALEHRSFLAKHDGRDAAQSTVRGRRTGGERVGRGDGKLAVGDVTERADAADLQGVAMTTTTRPVSKIVSDREINCE
jgi:hypothetical protein